MDVTADRNRPGKAEREAYLATFKKIRNEAERELAAKQKAEADVDVLPTDS